MKHTKFTCFLWAMLSASIAAAQGADELRAQEMLTYANEYFRTEQYNAAAALYREAFTILRDDPLATYQLAESYRFLLDYNEAEIYYRKAFYLDPENFPLSEYYYGLMLKLNGHHKESVEVIESFLYKYVERDEFREIVEQAAIDLAGAEMALKDQEGESLGSLHDASVGFNTEYNDFAPAPLADSLLLVTSGRIASNRRGIDERYGEAFTDHYLYLQKEGTWTESKGSFLKEVNSYYNDGSGQFSQDGNKYYFTECGGADGHCVIKVVVFDGRKWQHATKLNEHINLPGYETKQPALTKNGDTLFFVSDRPGGMGENDIWYSIKVGKGENWGPPINMGKTINTSRNEVSPFVHTYRQILFFASEGHQGYGGFDIHMAKRLSTGDTVMHNLGLPVNSYRDDFYFAFNDQTAFFSSNRPQSKGGFDIFSLPIRSPIALISKVSLRDYSGARDVNLKSRLTLSNSTTFSAVSQEESVEHAQLIYKKEAGQAAPKDKAADVLLASLQVPSSATHHFVLTGKIVGASTRQLYLKSEEKLLETVQVATDGSFRFSGLRPDMKVSVYAKAIEHGAKISVEDMMVDSYKKKHEISDIDNIYFDFDHYDLRPEAKMLLTELAEFLKAHPEAQIEVHAFSDNIGSNIYNLRLSEKRGKSVLDFLAQKGVSPEGMKIAARGKHRPVSNNNTEVGRQLNRRVEFYIYNAEDPFESPYETYIIREKCDLKSLAKKARMNSEAISTINNITSEQIKAYQPVRLPKDLVLEDASIIRISD